MQTSITPIEAELNGLYQVLDRHLTNNICPPVRNCLPALLGDNDCVITALTGSGKKTVLATALLYLTSPHFASNGGAIILTPTHSIAKQVRERFISVRRLMAGVVGAELANIIPLYDFSLTLESPAAQQQCFQPNSICIGTPGCMLDALRLRRRQLPMEEEARGGYWRQSVMTEHLSGRRVLVALVNAELLTHTELECSVRDLLDTLGRAGNRYRLILMASSIPKFTVAEFIEREMRQPQFIIVKPEDCLGRVDYSYLLFPVVSGTADSSGELLQRKVAALIWLYRRHIQLNGSDQRLCVFCNSTQTARKLASSLHDSGIFASLMSCEERSEECERVQGMFLSRQSTIVLTTDAFAVYLCRVSLVVNFDFPMRRCEFLTRLGCCDRFVRQPQSRVISFVTSRDMPTLREIERSFHLRMRQIDSTPPL